jgi:hypothetical protein
MKISIEEIKKLNIISYIDYLAKTVSNIEMAVYSLPFYQEQHDILRLRQEQWISYYLEKGKTNDSRFEKYKDLSKIKINDLDEKIEEAKNDLLNVVQLITDKKQFEILTSNINDSVIEKCLRMAKTIDFRELKNCHATYNNLFEASVEKDKKEILKKLQFNENALSDKLKELENTDFAFVEFLKNGTFCKSYFDSYKVCTELATLEFYKWLATYNEGGQPLYKPVKTLNKTQFTELVKALLEAGALQYKTEKQAVESLANALCIEIKKEVFDRILQKLKTRNTGEETKFIDTLNKALQDWIKKS